MVHVKPQVPGDEQHVAILIGALFQQIRATFDAEDWGGLRQSHFRIISQVPAEGISVTELAALVRMTKQGCGQFVAQLVETGHLAAGPSPEDARVRLVRRTPIGEDNVVAVAARMGLIEQEWRAVVGERRYAIFRAVAEELVQH